VLWLRQTGRVTDRRDLLRLLGLALLGAVVNQLLFLEGVRRTTAIHANILITTIPPFTLLVALLLGRERPTALRLLGIAIAGAGAMYLALAGGEAGEGVTVLGDMLVVLNTVCYASYLVLSKDLLKRYQPLTVITYMFLIGSLVIAPLGVPALGRVDSAALTNRTLLVLGYIVVFPSFLTYLMSIWSLKRVSSSLVAVYVYVQPVVTAFLGPAVLGEKVTSRSMIAAAVIFTGLVLASWGEQAAGGELRPAFRPPAEGA